MQDMTVLYLAALLFMALHLLVSGTVLRRIITDIIGEKAYLAVFSLASVGAIIWLVMSYNAAVTSAENEIYWQAPAGLLHMGSLVMLLALLLAVPGLLTPNPTAVGAEAVASRENAVQGMVRITRHPFLWGVVIWALFHLAANGDRASQAFFGTFATVAFFGTFSIDHKRARKMGAAWKGFAQRTSNLPFWGIIRGRTGFSLKEIGWWRIAAAVTVWAALLFGHEWLFGVSPFAV